MRCKILSLSLIQAGLIALLLLGVQSCAKNPVTGKSELMLMSTEQEKALGAESDPQVVAQYGLYPDETLQNFIDEKGQQMAAISHRPDLNYEFKILNSPVVNAFAVPGGYVYFTRGIMAHFNNEAQFAGVLGHEIGHITARHSANQYSRQVLAQVGLLAGAVFAPEAAQGALGDLVNQGVGVLFLKFGRDDESQSDRLGVEYSTKIGYDAAEMAGFFETLKRLSSSSGAGEIPNFLSTHPDPADRYERVREMAGKWRTKTGKTDLKVNRNSYLRMIDGITYGTDPREGYTENDNFYHPELRFQFPIPAGWNVQNTNTQVAIFPDDQKGAVILRLGSGSDPQAAANERAQQLELQVTSSGGQRINGLDAYSLLGDIQDQQSGQVLRVRLLTIKYGENIYEFIGFAPRAQFSAYDSNFRYTMENFRELNDPSKLNVQPERVQIRTAPRNMSLQEALRYFGTAEDRLQELSILNGMKLTDPVQEGMLIKTVGKSVTDDR